MKWERVESWWRAGSLGCSSLGDVGSTAWLDLPLLGDAVINTIVL